MQTSKKKAKPVREVEKPMMTGTWNGRDAYKMGGKLSLSIAAITLLLLLLGILLSFDSLVLRWLVCIALVSAGMMYLYAQGADQGEKDAALGEVMYERHRDGKPHDKADEDRCFHSAKGFFAVCIGVLPYVAVLMIFAVLTKPEEYTLGVLPSWMNDMTRQNEFGDALQYYSMREGMSTLSILRIVGRILVMPYVNVAILLGSEVVLWVERISPLLVMLIPMGYGFGYRSGKRRRAQLNASIAMGDAKKKRKEQVARKKRARSSKAPERLV